MELDHLKKNWELINKRLKENEVLNKRIIKEMITQRTTSAFNRIFHAEIICLAIVLIILPTFFILIQIVKYPPSLPWIITLLTLLGCTIAWTCIKIWWLKKFDIENKDIFHLSKIMNTYRNWILQESIISIFVVLILLTIRFITAHASNHTWFTTLIISVAILTSIYIFTVYKLFYKKHLGNIQKSLNELKEFKE